jgi:putative transposase
MSQECFAAIEPLLGTKAACAAVGRSRASHDRWLAPPRAAPRAPRPAPANKLGQAEVDLVLATLNSERFADASPTQAYYVLLDERTYIASVPSFYRVLRRHRLVRERRRQAALPPRVRPELVARRPNVVWSWDITKLKALKRACTTTFTGCWTFSAATSSLGAPPPPRTGNWPKN